jgi:hypothetical protein
MISMSALRMFAFMMGVTRALVNIMNDLFLFVKKIIEETLEFDDFGGRRFLQGSLEDNLDPSLVWVC